MQLSELLRAAAAQGLFVRDEDGKPEQVVIMTVNHIDEIEKLERLAHLVSTFAKCDCERQFCDHFNEAVAIANEINQV